MHAAQAVKSNAPCNHFKHLVPFVPRAAEIDQEKDPRLGLVAKVVAEVTTMQGVTTWLMEHERWDFLAVYFDGIDHLCHGFMKYHPPRRPFIAEQDFDRYQGVVEAGYRYHDLMLQRLVELAGDDTTIILVSDHGFHSDHLRPDSIPLEPAGPAHEHRDVGIFVMKGAGIKEDARISGVTLVDVTPTILTLFGLPIGEDMHGRPLLEAWVEPPQVQTIPSWEAVAGDDGRHPRDMRLDPAASEQAMHQLVALGYIERPDQNRERAIANTTHELQFNLARSYMDADRHREAVDILRRLRDDRPGDHRVPIQLAMCYRALAWIPAMRELIDDMTVRRQAEAERARARLAELRAELKTRRERRDASKQLRSASAEEQRERGSLLSDQERRLVRRLRAIASVPFYVLEYLAGFAAAGEGRDETALEHLARAERSASQRPGLHIQIGATYFSLKRWADAERAFAKAVEIDPDNPHAHLGLCRCHLARRRNRLARAEALTSVGLLYHYPMAHFCLGVALHRLRDVPSAVKALEIAVALNPNFREAHRRLAWLSDRWLRDPVKAAAHRAMLGAITKGSRLAHEAASRRATTPAPCRALDAYDEARGARSVERVSPELVTDRSDIALNALGQREFVVIVSGLPRSGTSMVMKMLADGGLPLLSDGCRVADPDNPFGYFEYEPVKQLTRAAGWVEQALGKGVKVVAQLLPYLPRRFKYRVIFIERDLTEVLQSQQRMLERRGVDGARLTADQLREAFDGQVDAVKGWLDRQLNVATVCVRYHDVLQDPDTGAVLINQFIGGGLNTNAMARAVDRTLYRNRVTSAL